MSSINEHDRIAVMAYVDGELPPEDAALFEPRLAHEPALAAAVARERALRARLQSAYAPVDEPVPQGLLDLLAGSEAAANVVPMRPATPHTAANDTLAGIARKPFGPALQAVEQALAAAAANPDDPAALRELHRVSERLTQRLDDGVAHRDGSANDPLPAGPNDAARAALPPARRWRWPEWSAMAASLVLGVVFGARLLAPHAGPAGGDAVALDVAPDGTITAQGALRDALEQRIGGTVLDPNSKVGVGLSFRNRAKEYCRTFTLDSASSGIACKQPAGWAVAQLEHGRNAREGEAGGYRTAASPLSPALLATIDAMRDGDTLDAAAETAAQARGWRP